MSVQLTKKELETGGFVLQWVMSSMIEMGYSDEQIKWLFAQDNIQDTLDIVRRRKRAE